MCGEIAEPDFPAQLVLAYGLLAVQLGLFKVIPAPGIKSELI